MSDLISRNALCEYCLNTKDRTIDANDIMRFPSVEPERTAKVTTVEKPVEGIAKTISVIACENCGSVVSIFDSYCSGCGVRLEWE